MGAAITPANCLSRMAKKKKKNTGIPYERLVQGIFQVLHDQEGVATIAVEQNKTLQGKISTHQIDVYWRFQTGGIEYEAIVQAKDWRSAVKQGDLFHFKCVVDDLPNQPRGIFVTRTGYQQCAKEFAAAQGIILYELGSWAKLAAEIRSFKVPASGPGGGTVEQLAMGIKATIFEPRYSSFSIQIDSTWFASNPDTTNTWLECGRTLLSAC
jgi:hypothetical protein